MAFHLQLLGFAILSFAILSVIHLPVVADLPDHKEIIQLLESNENITIELLEEFYQKYTGIKSEKVPNTRLFPLCISSKTLSEFPLLKNFAPIWEKMGKQDQCESRPLRFYEYNASVHSMAKNQNWIESIVLSRINTPELDVRNMRQWMHIKVKAKVPLRALYMQPVVGPIGLSSGEFSLEFECDDDPGGRITVDSMILHCDYRSRAELNHPVAFFGGYEGTNQITEFDVHYKYTDISCLETPFLQFMFIAIKDFKAGSKEGPQLGIDFQPLLSPVYTNIDFDSRDGVITPFYIGWKGSMDCFKTSHQSSWGSSTKLYHDTQFASLSWKESQLDRLMTNEDYDDCVSGRDTTKQDNERKECGPGPFQCPKTLSLKTVSDGADFEKIIKRRQVEFDEAVSIGNCAPCVFPTKEELFQSCESPLRKLKADARGRLSDKLTKPGPPVQGLDPYLHLDYAEFLDPSVDARYHGAIAIFSYFVIAPFSSLIARFFRGTPLRYGGKEDFWVVIHGALHFIGLFLLWISVGFVSTKDENLFATAVDCYRIAEQIKFNRNSTVPGVHESFEWTQDTFMLWLDKCTRESRKSNHSTLGIISLILHNLTVFVSFCRSRTDYIRNIQVIIHSHLAYADMILSVITIMFALKFERCVEVGAFVTVSAIFSLLIFLIMTRITSSEDEEVGIVPPRYKWPVLEPIKLSRMSSFYDKKIVVLAVHGAFLFFIWVFIVVSMDRQSSSESKVFAAGKIGKGISGLFGPCNSQQKTFFLPNLGKGEV